MAMLLFVESLLWSIIGDSGFVVSAVVPSAQALLSFHLLTGKMGTRPHLGFSDYQCRTAPAIQKHWYLVFGAYGLLRLDLLRSPLYQTWQRRLKTIGVALRRQSQALIEQMILECHRILSQGTHPEQLFKLLFGEAV